VKSLMYPIGPSRGLRIGGGQLAHNDCSFRPMSRNIPHFAKLLTSRDTSGFYH
jgi:hypothetical protein